eukprot:jgi/Chlat1/2302/Chrsp17S02594
MGSADPPHDDGGGGMAHSPRSRSRRPHRRPGLGSDDAQPEVDEGEVVDEAAEAAARTPKAAADGKGGGGRRKHRREKGGHKSGHGTPRSLAVPRLEYSISNSLFNTDSEHEEEELAHRDDQSHAEVSSSKPGEVRLRDIYSPRSPLEQQRSPRWKHPPQDASDGEGDGGSSSPRNASDLESPRTRQRWSPRAYQETEEGEEDVQDASPRSPTRGRRHNHHKDGAESQGERSIVNASPAARHACDSVSPRWQFAAADTLLVGASEAERLKFVNSPGPSHMLLRCEVRQRWKERDVYDLYLSETDAYLLSARRRPWKPTTNVVISADRAASLTGSRVAKLRGNFTGTEYVLYDAGDNPVRRGGTLKPRAELAGVIYTPSLSRVAGGPRHLTVLVPHGATSLRLDHADTGNAPPLTPRSRRESVVAMHRARSLREGAVSVLASKGPAWDPLARRWCYDFAGRVMCESKKNFQLETEGGATDGGEVILQFGKQRQDVYALDVSYPVTPLQAFGVALSAIDTKLCYAV